MTEEIEELFSIHFLATCVLKSLNWVLCNLPMKNLFFNEYILEILVDYGLLRTL